MPTSSLVIIGAGGFGRETAALVEDLNAATPETPPWDLLGFLDDAAPRHGTTVQGRPVLGPPEWLADHPEVRYVLAVGAAQVRQALGQRLTSLAAQPATLCHPSVAFHHSCTLSPGAILCRGVTLTVSVHLGRHVILNLHTTVGHDAVLGAYTTAHPGVHISGAAQTGAAVELGTGSVVLPGVSIGAAATVGAGAVVHRDLPGGCTAVGVPAHPLPR